MTKIIEDTVDQQEDNCMSLLTIARFSVSLLGLSLCCIACGDGISPAPRVPTGVRSSAVRLGELTDYHVSGIFDTSPHIHFRASSKSGSIQYSILGDGTASVDITPPSAVGILWADVWEINGSDYFMVSSVDAGGQARIHRMSDTNSDGLPEAGSIASVVDSGVNDMHWGSITAPLDDGTVFILDDRCKDILVVTDDNQDGWPNKLSVTPYARSDDYAQIDKVNVIVALGESLVLAAPSLEGMFDGPVYIDGLMGLVDTDNDLVADELNEGPSRKTAPGAIGHLYDGQDSVAINSGIAAAGRSVELWELDADDVDVAQLSSVTLDSMGEGILSLSSALAVGDRLGLRFTGEANTQGLVTVEDDRPQLFSVEPRVVNTGSGLTLTLKGANLSIATEIKMQDGNEGIVSDLRVATISGSSEITVSVPAFTGAHSGTAVFTAVDPSDPENTSTSVSLHVAVGDPFEITGFSPRSGPVGTLVTITGQGFEAAPVCEVSFGGIGTALLADITVVGDTVITVTVPDDAATGYVVVDQSFVKSTCPGNFTVTTP